MRTRLRAWIERIAERIPPVAVREMRSLMRGNRAPGVLLVCTALAAAVGVMLLWWQLDGVALSPEQTAKAGRILFTGVALLEAVLAYLLTPILTAGLLVREYQQKAIGDLLVTRLTGLEIAWGKLAAGLCLAVVAVACVQPLLALAFVLGGVSPFELIGSQLLVLAVAGYFGAAAINYAAHYRHPMAIMLATWGATPFTMVFLLPVQFAIFLSFTLPPLGLERITARLRLYWLRQVLRAVYVALVMLPAILLFPILITAGFVGQSPPVALAVLLFRDITGWMEIEMVWWLLPLLSAGMLAYGAYTMLDEAALMIRRREGEE